MSREIKYTTDGKKVVVIGSLNSQEKIVQEIFVVDGSEIPSGEHFVVKSLHDAPAVSWKEKNLKELEDRYERKSKEFIRDEDMLKKEWYAKRYLLKAKIEWAAGAIKLINPEQFSKMLDYMTGNIKWIVTDKYDPEIIPIEKFNELYEDKLRLVSIFGRTDGDINYAINTYYDGSGSWTRFQPFAEYGPAFEYFKEVLIKKGVSERSLKAAKEYGIELPKEDVDKYFADKVLSLTKNIEHYKAEIGTCETQIHQANLHLSQ